MRGRGSLWQLTKHVAAVAFAAALAVPAPAFAAPDPNKVLRYYFPTGESGFDPVRISDLYSATVIEAIFERLLTYDYLARPSKLVPMLAESMPEVADNGKTFTFHLRKGVYFAPDPSSRGRSASSSRRTSSTRTCGSWTRRTARRTHSCSKARSSGSTSTRRRPRRAGKFDYDAKIPGIEAVDRYTVRFRLKETDYNFLYVAAHISLGIVAREVIEGYADDTMAHPVGHRPLHADGLDAPLEDRARVESRVSRIHLGLRRRRSPRGTSSW